MKAEVSGTGSIVPIFFNFGARWGGWSTLRPAHFTTGNNPLPTLWEVGRAPGPV